MNLHQLMVFYEVAKEKSFSAAAEKLRLTQPTVTWQIKNLEEYYGLKFLERIGKKILLTEEGKVLFEIAQKFLNLSDQAELMLSDLKGLTRGNLRVDAVFTFGGYYLSALLASFHKKYPDITFQVHTGNTSQIIENTRLQKNDLAFVAYDPDDDRLVAREFISDILVAVVSRNHPLARKKFIELKDLNGQPLILREHGSSPRRVVDEIFKKNKIVPIVRMESASTILIKRMVENGMGIGILSRQVVRQEVLEKSLKELPFSDVQIGYRFFLIYHKDKYFSRTLKAFLDEAIEYSLKLSSGW